MLLPPTGPRDDTVDSVPQANQVLLSRLPLGEFHPAGEDVEINVNKLALTPCMLNFGKHPPSLLSRNSVFPKPVQNSRHVLLADLDSKLPCPRQFYDTLHATGLVLTASEEVRVRNIYTSSSTV